MSNHKVTWDEVFVYIDGKIWTSRDGAEKKFAQDRAGTYRELTDKWQAVVDFIQGMEDLEFEQLFEVGLQAFNDDKGPLTRDGIRAAIRAVLKAQKESES